MQGVSKLTELSADALRGARVLVRADLNVPLTDAGAVRDATRLSRLLPTLSYLTQCGARVGVLSHFGRPKGARVAEMSLQPVADALAALRGEPVGFAEDCIGDAAVAGLDACGDGGVCVLENTRFHPGEEANDDGFAAALAALGTHYVNDAFSAAHRAHASTQAIAQKLPAFAGHAMMAELEALDRALATPTRPVIAIVGGAKISTKLDLLDNLVSKVDMLVIGGGMANTFLAAQGTAIGKSLCEDAMFDTARRVMDKAVSENCRIILPSDAAIAPAFAPDQEAKIVDIQGVADDQMILDCGPQSVKDICAAFDTAKTLVWNGPLGAFEIPPFDGGTNAAAQYAAKLTQARALTSIAGGGDTVAALNQARAGDEFSYVSTAGGAFLEWLEGKTLPGVAVLMQGEKST